jgi:hypothetical protein
VHDHLLKEKSKFCLGQINKKITALKENNSIKEKKSAKPHKVTGIHQYSKMKTSGILKPLEFSWFSMCFVGKRDSTIWGDYTEETQIDRKM